MTDTEIIQNWIEAGESVLLRGQSGIGKTERIKALYPDLIYIKLTNNMFPEKVVGSVNLQTGQSIPPDFAKTAIMQEATEEERRLIEENIQNIYDIADTVYERSKESDKKVMKDLKKECLLSCPAVNSNGRPWQKCCSQTPNCSCWMSPQRVSIASLRKPLRKYYVN